MASLGRDDILHAIDLEIRTIPVPEWHGDICIRGLSGNERDIVEGRFRLLENAESYRGLRAFVLSFALCDEQRFRLFTTPEDVELLGEKNAAVLDRLFDIALEMAGIGDEAVEIAKKNLDDITLNDSGSVSP